MYKYGYEFNCLISFECPAVPPVKITCRFVVSTILKFERHVSAIIYIENKLLT